MNICENVMKENGHVKWKKKGCMKMKVGFIGLGIMGRPMAKNLLNAGVELLVSDLNKEAVATSPTNVVKPYPDVFAWILAVVIILFVILC